MFKPVPVIFIFWLSFGSAIAQTFSFNDSCRKAYNNIIDLKLNEGLATLKAEEKKNPDNLVPLYLENYVDFLNIYTSDTRSLYEQLKKDKDLRLAIINGGDPASPYYLFTQAEINLQWAALNIKFGDYLSAVFGIRRAFKQLETNRKRFPQFRANEKSLGVLLALLGSVPDKYKWGINLLGLEGNVDKGMSYLDSLISYSRNSDFIYRQETVTYYAFLLLHLQNNPVRAWQVLLDNGFPQKDNLMNVYSCADIGIYGQYNDEALQILSQRPGGNNYPDFAFLDYLTGLAHMSKLDNDAASYFKKFIAGYKGENHIKSAYQKIAWCSLLQGDTVNYLHFIDKAGKTGVAKLDADKQAQKEAEAKHVPDINLLRARVLFDGGYYEKASAEMNRLNEGNFKTAEDKTEYLYRLGRIYDAWGKSDSAILYYVKAIQKGSDLTRYFAANSALELGKIYENRNNKEKAVYYYRMCIDLPTHEYKDGLDQKAKAGLGRLQ
jgi:Tetratricopeptide repeat